MTKTKMTPVALEELDALDAEDRRATLDVLRNRLDVADAHPVRIRDIDAHMQAVPGYGITVLFVEKEIDGVVHPVVLTLGVTNEYGQRSSPTLERNRKDYDRVNAVHQTLTK